MSPSAALGSEWGPDLDAVIASFLGESGETPGRVSVWLGDLDGNTFLARDEDSPHYAASTMKLPLLVAAYRRAERGELDLDAEAPVHNSFDSALDGSPFSVDREEDPDRETWARLERTMTLRELARLATVRSGNLATNLLLEHVGAGELATVLADAGCSAATALPRGIEDVAAREAGLDNLVTARDLGLVMAGVAGGRLADARTCTAVEGVLSAQEHRDKIPAGLPDGTRVGNKTGWVEGVAHDVAVVRPGDRDAYVLAVCTTAGLPDEVASRLIAALSRTVWQAWAR